MATSDRLAPFDVVVVPFPYSDRLAEKRRPALVVSTVALARLGLVWVAMITSADNEPRPGDVAVRDLDRAGLPAPSVVRVAKLACIEPGHVLRRAGKLEARSAREVAAVLQRYLATA